MIKPDSKSYPYLAVAQWYEKPYGEVLKMTREELKGWQVAAGATADKIEDVKIYNNYAREIWNAAIEKAASELRMNSTGNWVEPYLEQIRKLKV